MLGEQIHADTPCEVIHMDFLYLMDDKYLLVIKDDFTGYVDFYHSPSNTATDAVNGLIQWISRLIIPKVIISDQGTHFMAEVVKQLLDALHIKHHVTPVYSAKSNGTIERVNREIVKVIRLLLSEYRMNPDYYEGLLPMVKMILNHSNSVRLKNRSPIEVLTGCTPSSPLELVIFKDLHMHHVGRVEDMDKEIKQAIEVLKESLEKMRKDVQVSIKKHRNIKKKSINRNRRPTPDYQVGDLVITKQHKADKQSKLDSPYTGPWRITKKLNQWTYEIQNIAKNTLKQVHIDHMAKYQVKDFVIDEALKEQMGFTTAGYQVKEFKGIKKDGNNGWMILTSWKGYTENDDTWEPITNMQEDVPDMLKKYISRNKSNKQIKEWLKSLKGGV